MMKSAEDWPCGDLAAPLDRPMARRILLQRQMCSEFVVIAFVDRKDLTQVGFAEDDDMIEAFPPDRANQSLRMPILPRRPRSRWVITDARGGKTPGDGMTVGPVTVLDEIIGLRSTGRHR